MLGSNPILLLYHFSFEDVGHPDIAIAFVSKIHVVEGKTDPKIGTGDPSNDCLLKAPGKSWDLCVPCLVPVPEPSGALRGAAEPAARRHGAWGGQGLSSHSRAPVPHPRGLDPSRLETPSKVRRAAGPPGRQRAAPTAASPRCRCRSFRRR